MDLPLNKGFLSTICGQVGALVTHNEAALSVVSTKPVRKRSLPESPENISAPKTPCFSQRHVSPVDIEAGRITRFVDLAKAIVRDSSPELLDRIDNDSWINMAQALAFSGIDTLEKAREMDLRPCPPCPLIHTWAALHGTTLFNGVNNPSRLAGLNYVERIRQEGYTLEDWGIPVIVVYSCKGLDKDQVDSMRAEFADHSNVLCLEFESELGLAMLPEFQQYEKDHVTVHFSDALRLVLSQNIEHTLTISVLSARSQGKTEMASRIEVLGYKNMLYSDIDNHWIRKPPFLLASRGLFTMPILSLDLSFLNLHEDYFKDLNTLDRELLHKHQSYFKGMPYYRRESNGWSRESADRVHDYMVSGEAQKNHIHLYQKIFQQLYGEGEFCNLEQLWHGDNGCIYLSADNAEQFFLRARETVCSIDLHRNPALSDGCDHSPIVWDNYFREAHTLMGVQLLRYYSCGQDNTWIGKWEKIK